MDLENKTKLDDDSRSMGAFALGGCEVMRTILVDADGNLDLAGSGARMIAVIGETEDIKELGNKLYNLKKLIDTLLSNVAGETILREMGMSINNARARKSTEGLDVG